MNDKTELLRSRLAYVIEEILTQRTQIFTPDIKILTEKLTSAVLRELDDDES